MSYLTAAIRARIAAQISVKEAQLTAANEALTAALGNSEIQTYRFDSGEGNQSATRRSPEEIQRVIARLERELDALYQRQRGGGIVNMNLRRYR